METVRDLESALKEAKKKEYIESKIKEMEDAKIAYEGKCFASNLFNRIGKSRSFGLVYYEKIFMRDGEVYLTEWVMFGNRHPAMYKGSTPTYSVQSYITERKVSSDEYNVGYNIFDGYSFYRKEISLPEFMSLWVATKESYLIFKEAFDKKPELEIEDIRQGDYSNEQEISKIINELGLDIIDLKDFPKMYWIFEYKTLPMLQNGRYIPRIYAKQLLQYVIKDFEKQMKDSWTTQRTVHYCTEKINVIREFINTQLT
jgi:hypothetical protein